MKLLLIVMLALAAGFVGGLAARYVVGPPRYAPTPAPARPIHIGKLVLVRRAAPAASPLGVAGSR